MPYDAQKAASGADVAARDGQLFATSASAGSSSMRRDGKKCGDPRYIAGNTEGLVFCIMHKNSPKRPKPKFLPNKLIQKTY
jgi:hypothetical protein